MSKEKILIFSDTLQSPTGFGSNTRRIGWALAKKYDVHVLGLQHLGGEQEVKFKIEDEERKVTLHPNKPLSGANPDFGFKSLPRYLDELEPEIILSLNDIHMCGHIPQYIYPQSVKLKVFDLPAKTMRSRYSIEQELNGVLQKYKEKYPLKTKWIQYAPIDALPPMRKWGNIYKTADQVVAFCKFGQNTFKHYYNMDVPYIYHGIDSEVFKPVDSRPDNVKGKFIVGDLNRNQIRKRPVQIIKAFAKFAKDKDDVLLHLQKDWNDPNGFNIKHFVDMYGLNNKLIKPLPRGVNRLIIRNIFNSWDVNMNCSSSEGFGLNIIESAGCGKPTIGTDYCSMPELIRDGKPGPRGQLVKGSMSWRQLNNAAGQQMIPDDTQMAKALQTYYDNRDLMKRHGDNARKWVLKNCTMKTLQYQWQNQIEEVLNR